MKWIANAAFGLEGLVSRDLKRLEIQNVEPQSSGGVLFDADWEQAFEANLWLRTADRVLLVCGQFQAETFEELFEKTKEIEWAKWIDPQGAFPVRAHCARSRLMSPSDCQSIVKKAVVESLKCSHRIEWFAESGATYQIDVSIHKDMVTIALDSSGESLSRRGYRTWNGEAPLRETLAAALVLTSRWRPNQILWDPCCGTGTIAIEAAFIAQNRAPGLNRNFAFESWRCVPRSLGQDLRRQAIERHEQGSARPMRIFASDVDADALELARRHVRQAGLAGQIELIQKDVRDLSLPDGPGAIVCNPPYGERLGDKKASQAVAKQLGLLKARSPEWSLSAISGDMAFERGFGRRADKKRRFYNGRLECEYYTYR